jgi:hypothetical protein
VRQLADRVRRCRRDEQEIDRRGKRDVLDVGVGAGLELVTRRRVSASNVTAPTKRVAE